MKIIKIYRLEIWLAVDNRYKWGWHPLSDFYTDKNELNELEKEILNHYNELEKKYPEEYQIMKFADEWHEYLGKKIDEEVVDTHGFMPEIREYNLNQK